MRRNTLRVASLAVASTLVWTACGGGSNSHPSTAAHGAPAVQLAAHDVSAAGSSAGHERAAATAEQAFALDVVRRVGAAEGNVVVSPASLTTALAMLEIGAGGQTQAQIVAALHGAGLGPDSLAAGWGGSVRQLQQQAHVDHQTLDEADEVWAQRGLAIEQAYLQSLAADFATGMAEVDFAGDPVGAAGAIDGWVSDHTAGLIKHLFDPSELAQTEVVLADAVYLKAKWQTPFVAGATGLAPWHSQAGQSRPVTTMAQPDSTYPVSMTPALDAVELPYQGGHLAALVLMPPVGQLASFEQSLTPQSLHAVVAGLQDTSVDLTIPKLKLTSTINLNETMKQLGIVDAFGATADLHRISAGPLVVSEVKQVAALTVDEKGTVAAAATGVAMASSAAVRPQSVVHLDHPFLMLIRDTTTGAILFSAQVEDPAAA